APVVVADLELLAADGLHEVQILAAPYFAQHDVADPQRGRVNRDDGAQLAGFDLASHRVAPGPKRDGLAGPQALDMSGCPAHCGPPATTIGRNHTPTMRYDGRRDSFRPVA